MAHSHESEPNYPFDLSGGMLCLDFVNTISRRKVAERSIEHLGRYDDLVVFAEQSRVLSPQQADKLRTWARQQGSEASAALRKATSYREVLYRAFSALVEGKPAASDDLQRINDFATESLNHRRLVRSDGHYRWEWQRNTRESLDSVLWPIAQSAAELLTSSDLAKVRLCEAPDCAWLFLDQSRNRSRRWCDMKVCGNREKARRHYRRAHG